MGHFGSPDGLRTTVTEDEFGGFRILIRSAPNWSMRLFLPVGLCAWWVGEMVLAITLVSGPAWRPDFVFRILWLVFWTIGGAAAFLILAWNWAGREVIVFTEGWLELRRQIGRFSWAVTFDLSKISYLRYSPVQYNPYAMRRGWSESLHQFGIGGGAIAFEYEGTPGREPGTYHFGDDLPEIEARRLIMTISQRYKFPGLPVVEPLPIRP